MKAIIQIQQTSDLNAIIKAAYDERIQGAYVAGDLIQIKMKSICPGIAFFYYNFVCTLNGIRRANELEQYLFRQ